MFSWYIVITLALCYFGPWDYPVLEPFRVTLYIGAALVLFNLGHRTGHAWAKAGDPRSRNQWVARLARLAIWGYCASAVLGIVALNPARSLPLIEALRDPGRAYRLSHAAMELEFERTSVLEQARVLGAPIALLGLASGAYLFRRLSGPERGVFLLGVALQVAKAVRTGTLKDLGDLVIIVSAVVLIRHTQRGLRGKGRRPWLRLAALGLPFAVYVGFNLAQRLVSVGGESLAGIKYASPRWDHPVFQLFSQHAGLALSMMIFYLSHGYAGLSASLGEPFQWCWGLGSSIAIQGYAEQYFGLTGVFERTYLARAEVTSGWPALGYWSTVFPWLASDLTFGGALAFMWLVGRCTAKSWSESVRRGDLLSVAIFCQLVIFLLYVPANNQLLQSRYHAVGAVGLFFVWTLREVLRWPAVRRVVRARRGASHREAEVQGVVLEAP
jgi:hypothetical protein